MHKRGILAAVVAVVSLTACGGGNLCDTASDAYKNLNSKVGSCQITGLPVSFNKTTCNDNLSQCTSSEQDAMKNYFNCIDNVGTCTVGNEQAWTDQVNTCSNSASQISAACGAAVNPQ